MLSRIRLTFSALIFASLAAMIPNAVAAPMTNINFGPAAPPQPIFLTPEYIPLVPNQDPLSVATADFNGDGNVDIAVRTFQGVEILIGDGKGNFSAGQFTKIKQATQGFDSITVADMNHDGIPDLVTTTLSGPEVVSILLGNGDGTFQAPKSFSAQEPLAVAVGDFNGDGKLDVAVAQAGNNSVGILMGNGDGTLQPEFNYALQGGGRAETIAIGDLNGDGKLDIVSASRYINVFFGNGDGTFQTAVALTAGASEVQIADVNNDGQQDIVFGTYNGVAVYLNQGGGKFGGYIVSQGGGGSFGLADFNHDGKIDAFSGETVLYGLGNGKFQASTTHYLGIAQQGCCTAVTLADVNNDGILDLVNPTAFYGNPGSTGDSGINVTLGAGNGRFLGPQYFPGLVGNHLQLVTGDFNGDGKNDVVGVDSGNAFNIFLGNGNGTFQPVKAGPTVPFQAPWAILAGDFNNDKKLDVVVMGPRGQTPQFALYLGNGDGTFQTPVVIDAPGTAIEDIGVGDFNHDGKLDVVVLAQCINSVNCQNGLLTVMLGDGHGGFTAATGSNVNQGAYLIKVGEFNNRDFDHTPDVVVENNDTQSVSEVNVLLSKGDGTFGTEMPVNLGSLPPNETLVVADFNNDGNLDIAVGLNNGITFVPGQGNGRFGTAVNTPSPVVEVPVAVADFNGDGKVDILDNVGNIVIGNGDGTFQPSFPVVGQQVGEFLPALLGNDKYPDILIGDGGVAVVVNQTK